VYDRVRDFCPKCIYCNKIYLNQELLAHHFLTRHLLDTTAAYWCPHCHTLLNQNILAHVQTSHSEKCLLCGCTDVDANHVTCTRFVKNAIKKYFQEKISLLLNLLEGFETI
jgi:hypothetical protein